MTKKSLAITFTASVASAQHLAEFFNRHDPYYNQHAYEHEYYFGPHDAHDIRSYDHTYGGHGPYHDYGHYYSNEFEYGNNESNDWGLHDAYGIRPYEDAYGRPVLFPAHSYSPYNVQRQQYKQRN